MISLLVSAKLYCSEESGRLIARVILPPLLHLNANWLDAALRSDLLQSLNSVRGHLMNFVAYIESVHEPTDEGVGNYVLHHTGQLGLMRSKCLEPHFNLHLH